MESRSRSAPGHVRLRLGISRSGGAGFPHRPGAPYKAAMRRPLVLLLVLLLALGGASFALWSWTVGRLRAGFDAWAQQAAAQGWTVRAGTTRGAGWPVAGELVMHDLTLAANPDVLPGGATWTAARAVLHISPLAPQVLEIRLQGTQRVRVLGDLSAPFESESFVLTVPLPGPGPVHMTAHQIRFGAPVAGMSIGLLDGQLQQQPDSLGFDLSAEAMALPAPPAPQPALGRRIASATITGSFDGPWPPGTDPAARAALWQKGGGTLRVRHLAVGWGPLGVTGTASFGLDPSLQPLGTGTARVVGYEPALSALAAGGAITPAAAQAVRAVLALLARTPDGGGAPEVELPLDLHDGVVHVGHIPVGRMQHWDWSASR